jgi:aspartyl/asparaginyl-tRNA synthetase
MQRPARTPEQRETDLTVLRRVLDLLGVHPDRFRRHLDSLASAPPRGGFELELDRLLTRGLRCDSARELAPADVV